MNILVSAPNMVLTRSVGVSTERLVVGRLTDMCQRKQVALTRNKTIIQSKLSFDDSGKLYGYANNKAGILAIDMVLFQEVKDLSTRRR